MRGVIVLAAIALVAGCNRGDRGDGAACPAGSRRDQGREARVRQGAMQDAESRALLDSTPVQICFSDTLQRGTGTLVEGGSPPTALLPAVDSDMVNAARLAHLARHLAEPPYRATGDRGPAACARTVERAEALERSAHDAEARVAAALGAKPPDPTSRHAVVDGYRTRCLRQAAP